MSTREDFEAWAISVQLSTTRCEGLGGYAFYETRKALESWQAATSRQEAKIKQMLEALEAIAEYMPSTSAVEGGASRFSGNVHAADKVCAAIAAAKEPDLSCAPRGITE